MTFTFSLENEGKGNRERGERDGEREIGEGKGGREVVLELKSFSMGRQFIGSIGF